MADNDIQHRPTQYADQNTVSALSQMQQQNADKWRSVNAPGQFNQGTYSPSYTGNPLVDAGIALAGQKAYQLAGGMGTPRFITPYAPGTSQMMMDLAANQIGPMHQSMMQQFNRQVQPLTSAGLNAMSSMGFGRQAQQVRQAMNSNPFLTDLAAMANQTPMLQSIMGGNIFRGQDELLNRAGSFGVGGPPAFSPQMMMQRNAASMMAANSLGRAIMDRTYRDPATGKFNMAGNAGYTGGWGGEDMQRLAAEMAARNVSQPMAASGGGAAMMGMSSMRVDPGFKADMVGRMGRAMAGVAAATGISDPVEALRMVQQNLGGGPNSRNMNSIASAASQLATIGGVSQMFGMAPSAGVGVHQAVLAGADMRMSLMADPSGNTSRAGGSMARAMAKSAAMNAMAEAGATGARSPEDLARLGSKYGRFTMDRLNSNEFRETSLANAMMATNPAMAARYGAELQQSMLNGNTANTRRIIQDMSQVTTGTRGGIAAIAANDREYVDHLTRYDRQMRSMGINPDMVAEKFNTLVTATDKKELVDITAKDKIRNRTGQFRSYVGRAGIAVTDEDMAETRRKGILDKLEMLHGAGTIKDAQMNIFNEAAKAGGAKGLQALQNQMALDPNYGKYKGAVDMSDSRSVMDHYAKLARSVDPSSLFTEKWTATGMGRVDEAVRNDPGKRKAWEQKSRELQGMADLQERGRKFNEFISGDEGLTLVGRDVQAAIGDNLTESRTQMALDYKTMGSTVMQPGRTASGGDIDTRDAAAGAMNPDDEAAASIGGKKLARADAAAGQESSGGWMARAVDALPAVMASVIPGGLGLATAFKGVAAATGIDVSEIGGAKEKQEGTQRGAGGGKNTMTEVSLKPGTRIYIIDEKGGYKTGEVRPR